MFDPQDLLRYYLQELAYLRDSGMAYAERYPKVASRLQLEPRESPDPHVERLIEAVAFLTARARRNFDQALPELAGELIEILYPHYLQPVPPMTIAQFRPDLAKGGLTGPKMIPRGTRLFTHATSELICHFRTGYDVTLWPVAVTALGNQPPRTWEGLRGPQTAASMIWLRLESRGDPWQELAPERLRFYLHGSESATGQLYELIMCHTLEIQLRGAEGQERLAPEAFEAVGFGLDEALLPGTPQGHPAYRLLQEYFVFPAKFRFVDLVFPKLLFQRLAAMRVFELAIFFDREPERKSWLELEPETFALGCTPVINLFPRTTEPVRIDQTRSEYRLVADRRRERFTEIQSIRSVSTSADVDERSRRLTPYYSFEHDLTAGEDRAFWHDRRVPTRLPDTVGTDILISFHDLGFQLERPATDVLYAHVWCNNRNLAQNLRTLTKLQSDETDVPAVTLALATQHLQPGLDGETRWRLISHLSLNYLSLTEGEQSLRNLKEILELYNPTGQAAILRQIRSIVEMRTRSVLRRIRLHETWRGFVRGTEIELVLDDDEQTYTTGGDLLFATTLNHFFALYAPVDSFTQLVVRKSSEKKREWKRWPPMIGERVLP